MNLTSPQYKDFALVQEMLRAPEIIGSFDFGQTKRLAQSIKETNRFYLTGEGSSRIFPAKSFMSSMYQRGLPLTMGTSGGREASQYDLSQWTVCGASNSGQTKELITLFLKLKEQNHSRLFGITANGGTKLTEIADTVVLKCGKEKAVAATMSVVEQALVYQSIEIELSGCGCAKNQTEAAKLAESVLAPDYDADLVKKIAAAPMVYLVGWNNGVAEELALKSVEITRKKSQFLEGTLVVHGIEEVMDPDEAVILIDPSKDDEEFIEKNLVTGIGITALAIASRPTRFPTIQIPTLNRYDKYLQLLAGWNLLVQVGVSCGFNLDKPQRARKIGNVFE